VTANAAVEAYEARRCEICAGQDPMFGFAPPFSERPVWSCRQHRQTLTEMLAALSESKQQVPSEPQQQAPTPAPVRTEPKASRKRKPTGDQHGLFE
jgi:hypothetical protein